MEESIHFVIYLVLHFTVFSMYGGRYSLFTNEIKRLTNLKGSGKYESEKLDELIVVKQTSINKNKTRALVLNSVIVIAHLLHNVFTFQETETNYLAFGIFAFFVLGLQVVYFLKGSGTIDSNKRFHTDFN